MKSPFHQLFNPNNSHATVKLVLRFVVALYVLYLTKGLIEKAMTGSSSVPTWVTVLVSTVFILASIAFCVYAWIQYRHSLALAAKEDAESDQEDSHDDDNQE